MARWVCSASAVEALVLRSIPIEPASLLCRHSQPPVQLRASYPRLLSRRCFSTTKRHLDGVTPARARAGDDAVPLVQTGPHREHTSRPAQQISWPAPKPVIPEGHAPHEPELDIDEEVLSRFIQDGLHRETLASQTVHKEAGPTATTSRVQSRLARKHRRMLASGAPASDVLRTQHKLEELQDTANKLSSDREGTLQTLDDEAVQVAALLAETEPEAGHTHVDGKVIRQRRMRDSTDESADKSNDATRQGTLRSDSSAHPETKSSNEAERDLPSWLKYKRTIKEKFGGQAWNPRKRISPDAIAGVRSLHEKDPVMYSTPRLADYFQISPEAIRRILRSKWQPNAKQVEVRRQRWENRGVKQWTQMAEQGIRPPRKWRELGAGKPAEDSGGVPTWQQVTKGGERWIEHRPPEALFASAASHFNRKRDSIAKKIF